MIPATKRGSRRLEATLLSYSRQSLPRPFRFYSTPTKRAQADVALATQVPSPDSYPPFPLSHSTSPSSSASSPYQKQKSDNSAQSDMDAFLNRRPAYTLLPTPLPVDAIAKELEHQYHFPDSTSLGLLAVIDACLHNCYDVPRATEIFNNLREQRKGLFLYSNRTDPILTAKVYNQFLFSYLVMATTKNIQRRDMWLENLWNLFRNMEMGRESCLPTASSYAIALLAYYRFGPKSENAEDAINISSQYDTQELLRRLLDRGIPVLSVVSDKYLLAEEAASLAKHLSRVLVQMRLFKVVEELSKVEGVTIGPSIEVPEAMPVTSENEVPFNINNLRQQLATLAFGQKVLQDDALLRQKMLEASAYDEANTRLAHEAKKLEELGINHRGLTQDILQAWMYQWHTKLQERLRTSIRIVQASEKDPSKRRAKTTGEMEQAKIGPFLSLLDISKLSLITILELMRLQGSGGISEGMKFARAVLTVGHAVELEYKAQILRKHDMHLPTRQSDQRMFTEREYRKLVETRKASQSFMDDNVVWLAEWVPKVRARVGGFLVENLLEVATITRSMTDPATGKTITEEHPAFSHTYEYIRGQRLGVLRLHPIVGERLSKDDLNTTLHPRHLPMLIKPKPWMGVDEGGYIYNKSAVMRLKDTLEQQQYLEEAVKRGNCELIFQGLDILGSTPWRINRPIFDVVLQVWNSGQRFHKIPPSVFDEPEPEKPEDYEVNQESKSRYHLMMQRWITHKAGTHSERCSVNYKVEIARSFLNDVFYLPHNIDFRGRAYPLPPHLNHMGDDLSRGLMKFAEARPLGPSGLRWLKIHLANLYGYDKASFDERVRFVEDRLEDIFDSAEKPLEGKRWWAKADDSWQCLSACIELRNALTSPDPETYESDLPVHQDGTCNGLQHYAALGGDVIGAKQVNLDAGDRPSDVYTFVANGIERIIEEDCARGIAIAELLKGKISRKVVKQTVMTTVYGVTFIGARSQVAKQLRDRGDIPIEHLWEASTYLARRVMIVIGDLFAGAKDIMTWLTISARLISKSVPISRGSEAAKVSDGISRLPKEQMTSVIWTTPLGLPVCQPYRKAVRKQIVTSIQTVFIADPSVQSEVNSMKQSSAFPPNFIHSLDATHMMLTALECAREGLTFASVHDSYWTHAGSVEKMNAIIRETFISLHSSPILEKLREEFMTRYSGHVIHTKSLLNTTSLKKLRMNLKYEEPSKEVTAALENPTLSEEAEDEGNADAIEELEEVPAPETGTKKKRKSANFPDEYSTYVPITKLIPPLPSKGNFDVNIIRQSPYFFS